MSVGNAVNSITITPTGAGVLTVNGVTVASGVASGAISLTAGTPAVITIVATETGKSAKTYTISVTRSNTAQATPTFSPVAGAIAFGTTVTITSATADAIYYTTNGVDPTTGSTLYSAPVAINSALTLKALAVKAGADNSAIGSAAYTQAVTADLTSIALSGSPTGYTSAVGTYTYNGVSVANGISSVTVTPTGAGTITVDGQAATSGQASQAIALTAGVQKAIVIVATEAGKSAKTYTINVTRNNIAVINIAAIPGVTAPVTGATPVTTITETAQYTGTVAWSGSPSTFASNTAYTATITLTAKAGYTLTGVGANFFTVAGATATNPANSGVITAAFPSTLAGAATKYIVTSSTNSPAAGSNVTITAQLADANNNPVSTANLIVTWTKSNVNGSFATATSTTDASGIATVVFTTHTVAGTATTVTATDGGSLTGTSGTITTTGGAATKYIVTSISNSPAAGSNITITAQLSDANNNAVNTAGLTVTWSKSNGNGSFATPTSNTNGSGIATVVFTTHTVAGTATTVTGTDGGSLTGTSATITTAAGTATKYIVNSTNSSPVAGSSVTITAQLADANNNAVSTAGLTVNWSKSNANGSFASATSTTNSSGIATVVFTTHTVAGTSTTVTATDGSSLIGTTATITTVVGNATQIAVNTGNNQNAIAGASVTPPSVIVKDLSNNPVSGVSVTFAVATGGGSATGLAATTDAGGVATIGSWTLGTTAGINTLTATSAGFSGSPVTFTAIGTAGTATQIVVNAGNNQSAIVGTAAGTAPSVTVKDANNNPVNGVSVTFAVTAGGGSIANTATQTTNASGIAGAGTWTLGAAPGTNTLTATSGSLTGSPLTFTATGVSNPSNDLSNIVLNGAPANYTFGAATYTYNNVRVSNTVSSITVTPKASSGTIRVNGTTVSSESATSIALTVGVEKTIDVTVTETGKDIKTYTIKVTRQTLQITPTFSVKGPVPFPTQVTITSTGADAIYYTTDNSAPTRGSTLYSGPVTVNLAMTIKVLAVKAGSDDSVIGLASYTQAVARPGTTVLSQGSQNPVGNIINVIIPEPDEPDITGTVTGWVADTNNKIKFTVIDSSGISTITIDGSPYTSGTDYAIESTASLRIIVKTTQANKADGIRTFIVAVKSADAQAIPVFTPGTGPVAAGISISISSPGANEIYYTTDGSTPNTMSTKVTGTIKIDSTITVRALALRAGLLNSPVKSVTYVVPPATTPTAIQLVAGSSAPVGGVTNVAIPAVGATDSTGVVTGWVSSTNNKIKFIVTNGGSATSTIKINGVTHSNGADYTIASIADLPIVVTTTETGRLPSVRKFLVTVTGAATQFTPKFIPTAGPVAFGSTVVLTSPGADEIYYTKDGSTPTTSSTKQSVTPVVINSGATTVKAMAFKSGLDASAVSTANYTQAVTVDMNRINISGTPSSYIFDPGIYSYNFGVDNTSASINVTPTGLGMIAVNGTIVASGSASAPIALDAGVEKSFSVIATESGKIAKTYSYKVIRAKQEQIVPDPGANVIVSNTTPELLVTAAAHDIVMTVPAGTTNPTLDYGTLMTSGAGSIPQTTIISTVARVSIPESVITSTNTSWNGVMAAPTPIVVNLPPTATDIKIVSAAIELGSTQASLSFNNAVRILMPGQAGKRVGYVKFGGELTEITTIGSADSQTGGNSLPADGALKIDVGSDLVVWTKHFTKFIAYTQKSTVATITSGIYTILSNSIINVSNATDKTTFLAALNKGQQDQVWDVTGIDATVISGNKLISTAQDGVTKIVYTILLNDPALTLKAGIVGSNQVNCDGIAFPIKETTSATGGSGTYTYQWQKSVVSAITGFTNITGATNLEYAPGNVNQTTWYRRLVSSPGFNSAPAVSNVISISIVAALGNNLITPPVLSAYCQSGDPSVISGSNPTPENGSYLYQWQSSANGTTFTNINGATSRDYDPAVLTDTIYYQRVVSTGSCISISDKVAIYVTQTLINNTITASNILEFCSNGDPEIITGSIPSNGNGNYMYQWQSSIISTTDGFINIAGATSKDHDPGAVTQTTYYRRQIKYGFCTFSTNVIKINILPDVRNNIITAPSSLSFCQSGDPALIIASTPTGGSGNLSYQWQRSTTSLSNGFIDINGATSKDYDPGIITQTTYFRREISVGSCSYLSNAITFVVTPSVANNMISSDQTIISGNKPLTLNGSVPTAGDGKYDYLWESSIISSTSGFAPAEGINTTQDYSPAVLAQTTYFRRRVTSGNCQVMNSNIIRITLKSIGSSVIGIAKTVSAPIPQLDGKNTNILTYKIIVKNYGIVSLDNVQVIDDLRKTFPFPTEFTVEGVSASSNNLLKINSSYNGNGNNNLLQDINLLQAGESDTIRITVKVTPANNMMGPFYNSATASARDPLGTVSNDMSVNGTNPDPDNNGKPEEDSATPVMLEKVTIRVPEGYSPNGDGVNDVFIIENLDSERINLYVYNALGSLVYSNTNYQNDWSGVSNQGSLRGKDIPDGTYYYIISKRNNQEKYTRFITIKR